MILVNVHEAKAKLSEYLEAARSGERVLICRHNRPVAELRAVEEARMGPRDLTPMFPGATFTTDSFFAPLSAEELSAWQEGADSPALRVTEEHAPYGQKKAPARGRAPRRRR